MNTRVFCGPTLSGADAAKYLPDASIVGPAALGDVLQAVEDGVQRLAIIDGFFDQRQPPWHKEILWALHRGVQVYGAASMGALRAVELAPFGMVGVGRIFELFRDGWLERDDEVTVVHGLPDTGYRQLSEALVNMRFTFRRAASEGVIGTAFAEQCTAIAERTFYVDRSYAHVCEIACELPGAAGDATALRRWLGESPTHRVDQKRDDALALLQELQNSSAAVARECAKGAFDFAHTSAWKEFLDRRGSH